ncbi:MAG: POTRA domain-containing protein [Bryobacteraceae bacterium]
MRTQKALVFLLFFSAGLLASAGDYEGRTIASVSFEPKLQPLPASELNAILRLRRNQPLRMQDVRETIDRLYATGRYSDIVVEADEVGAQVAVRIRTKGNWFVGPVTVLGAVPQPPGRGPLVNASGLKLGAPFYTEDLETATANLKRVLANNGFFQPSIQPRVWYEDRTQQASITFEIQPGPRARFGPPVWEGQFQDPPGRLQKATGWRGWFGWRRVTEERTQNGIQRILRFFSKRDYLMARVSLDRMEYDPSTGTAIPHLTVTQGPPIVIEVQGAKVGRGRLRRLIPIFEEQTVDRELLEEGARRLAEYLQTEGYFDARVTYDSSQSADGRMRIVYKIERGERHKLAQIEIRGNRYFDERTLRERLLAIPAGVIHFRRGRFSANILERDLNSIQSLYRANGFREVKITAHLEENYRGKRGQVALVFQIQEGPQWLVSQVEFQGVSPEHEAPIRGILQSAPGQPFSEANVAADRDNILAYYYDRGYSEAQFEYAYRPSPEPSRMELQYTIREGPSRVVREVLLGGLDATRPQLVHQRLGINVGDPLSPTQMILTQRRLYDLGIFAKVETAIQNPEGEELAKYVDFQMEESRKFSISGGFGAEIARIGGSRTDLTAPAGQAGFSPRVSFDISRLNFLGRAHTVSLRTRVSTLQQRALLSYLAPQFRGRQNLDLTVNALFDTSKNVRTFSARRWEGSSQIAHRWTRSKTFFYRFAYRRVSVDQNTLNISKDLIPLLSQPVRVGVFSASYVDDRRDDPIDSSRGTYNSLDLGVALRLFVSETDYGRLLARNSTYHPLVGHLVLARNTSFGLMTTLRRRPGQLPSPQDIPLPERFFAGGATSHRAFPENQAGPRDLQTGFPLGGKALLTFNTELRFPIAGQNIRGVLFHDAGNVYSSVRDISFRVRQHDKTDFDYMVHSVGLGLRYRTPVGPIRLDLSFSPNSPRFFGCSGTREDLLAGRCNPSDQRINRLQFHFSLGQTF